MVPPSASSNFPGFPVRLAPVLSLPAQGEVLVPGDLAQPHPQPALPPEGVDGLQRPEDGLLGHFLRRVGVPAEGQGVAVHVREIRPVDLLKILHSLTSPALMDKTRVRLFRYSRRRNFPHTGGPCVSLPGII